MIGQPEPRDNSVQRAPLCKYLQPLHPRLQTHFRHHPLVDRVKEIIDRGEIGELTSIEASFSAYLPFNDFRFYYALGGGCTIGSNPLVLVALT